MSADGVPSHYTSYLLRVWRVCEQDRMTCRALLENIATGERMGFSDLDGLKMFLETGGLRIQRRLKTLKISQRNFKNLI